VSVILAALLYENNSAREEVKHGEIYTGSSRASYFACMQIGSGRMGLAAATAAAPAPATRQRPKNIIPETKKSAF
jgi:hypothetical protein